MLENYVFRTSRLRLSVDANKEHFEEVLGTFLQNVVNIKTCSTFSILVNENWDQRRSNWQLAESLRGGISVTENVVLRIKLTIIDRNIGIYIWPAFHMSQNHSTLSMSQTEPFGKTQQREIVSFNFGPWQNPQKYSRFRISTQQCRYC